MKFLTTLLAVALGVIIGVTIAKVLPCHVEICILPSELREESSTKSDKKLYKLTTMAYVKTGKKKQRLWQPP